MKKILFLVSLFLSLIPPATSLVLADELIRAQPSIDKGRTQGTITEHSITIYWKEVNFATNYIVRAIPMRQNDVSLSKERSLNNKVCSSQICNTTFNDLLSDKEYLFQIIAFNSISQSVPTTGTFWISKPPTPTLLLGKGDIAPPPTNFLESLGAILTCNPILTEGCNSNTITFPRETSKFNTSKDFTLGNLITQLLNITFIIAAFLAFIWMVWGAFEYIFAGGNKEGLVKARSRIIWAVMGLIFLALAFFLSQFLEEVLLPEKVSPLSFVTTAYAATPTPIGKNLEVVYSFGFLDNLGQGIDRLRPTVFSIATLAVVVYFIWGAFTYITSGGDKEGISKARDMITHAVIGFLILMFVFLIIQFIFEFFKFDISIFR